MVVQRLCSKGVRQLEYVQEETVHKTLFVVCVIIAFLLTMVSVNR
jgi:hypothetical protein